MTERSTAVFDALLQFQVERVRFKSSPSGLRILAARRDGAWENALALIPEAEADLTEIADAFRLQGHERLDLVFREEIGLRFLCAVHSTARGPGAGGLRRRDLVVPEKDIIGEALNLSRAMTYKNAFAGVPHGGSKLLIHGSPIPDYDRSKWIEIIAEEIEISGTVTGPDTGLPRGVYVDLAALSSQISGVRGGGTGESAAFGVYSALQAAGASWGNPLSESKVVVQGLGAVGTPLSTALVKAGAKLVVTDLDHRKIDVFLSGLSQDERRQVGVVAPYQILDVECDALSPNATSGVITPQNVRKLKCRAVCGAANNQLHAQTLDGELRLAQELRDAGVIYVPDWMASVGGTVHGTMELEAKDDFDLKKCHARIRRLCGWQIDEVLEQAKRSGRTPLEIATERFLKGSVT